MEQLLENYHRLIRETKDPYIRSFFTDFRLKGRLHGIVGARGTGKTSFLLYYLKNQLKDSKLGLYISADHIYFAENSLVQVAEEFYNSYGGELLCIDEIHKYPNWNQELKNIYDFFPKLKIIFSGSSSIDLIKGKYDLSRRASLSIMNGFSFREYLEIKTANEYPRLLLKEIISGKNNEAIAETPKLLKHFKDYLKQGYYPIFLETEQLDDYFETLMNMIEKVIYEDIASFYSLKTQNLVVLKKILFFLASTPPGSFSINKLAKSISKDHSVTAEYIEMLRETGLLRYLLNDKHGHALIRNAEKIYFNNPNLVFAINHRIGKENNIGSIRELFVLSQLQNSGHKVFYSKDADMICEDYIFEIGGKSKDMSQIKSLKNAYLVKDDSLIHSKNTIPLYLFGFLA